MRARRPRDSWSHHSGILKLRILESMRSNEGQAGIGKRKGLSARKENRQSTEAIGPNHCTRAARAMGKRC